MRIQHEGGQVWLRDHVAPFWALGAFLFAGGALGIGLPLGLAENAGELRDCGSASRAARSGWACAAEPSGGWPAAPAPNFTSI